MRIIAHETEDRGGDDTRLFHSTAYVFQSEDHISSVLVQAVVILPGVLRRIDALIPSDLPVLASSPDALTFRRIPRSVNERAKVLLRYVPLLTDQLSRYALILDVVPYRSVRYAQYHRDFMPVI